MERIHITHLEFNKEEFDHFVKGDGQFWYEDESGTLITGETVENWFKKNECYTDDDKDRLIRDFPVYKSFSDFEDDLDVYNDGDYDLETVEVGNTIVMIYAYKS